MTINHHLNDALLMAYSAGTLSEAFSLVVATHVSMCDDCRARLGSFDAVGGSLLEDCGGVPMNDGAFEDLLSRLDSAGEDDAEPETAAPSNGATVFPSPLRGYVGGDLDRVTWKRVGGGVRQAMLGTMGEGTVRLLHIPAGVRVPDHGHKGQELTMVLKGSYRDEHDRFGPGDVEIADEDLSHAPVAEAGEDCICLAATDAPLRFNALLPRIAQPFLRI